MKITADRSGWPTREIALLIAEPRPALRTGTELIRVLVNGATTSEMPTPNRRIAGSASISAPGGGTRLSGEPTWACQAGLVCGIRANHTRPAAIRIGPATRNG